MVGSQPGQEAGGNSQGPGAFLLERLLCVCGTYKAWGPRDPDGAFNGLVRVKLKPTGTKGSGEELEAQAVLWEWRGGNWHFPKRAGEGVMVVQRALGAKKPWGLFAQSEPPAAPQPFRYPLGSFANHTQEDRRFTNVYRQFYLLI